MARFTSSTHAAELAGNYDYCERLLRERDRDVWLACLFAPQEERKRLHALYAFEKEISGVREKVSQPLLGEMRLQWWSDILEASANEEVPQAAHAHPIADALLDSIGHCALPRAEFIDFVEAHISDFYDDAMEDMEALEYFCERTSTRLLRLAGQIISGDEGLTTAPFSYAGAALGLTHVLRDLPKHASRGQMLVPRSILAEHGASENDLRNRASTPQVHAALKSIRDRARAKYSAARETAAEAGAGQAALLPAALVPIYLDAMDRSDYEPFQVAVDPAQWRKQWRLWRASHRNGL